MKYINLKTLLMISLSASSIMGTGWQGQDWNARNYSNQSYFYNTPWGNQFGFYQAPFPSGYSHQNKTRTQLEGKKHSRAKTSRGVQTESQSSDIEPKKVYALARPLNPGLVDISCAEHPYSPIYAPLPKAIEIPTSEEPATKRQCKKKEKAATALDQTQTGNREGEMKSLFVSIFNRAKESEGLRSTEAERILKNLDIRGAELFSLEVLPQEIRDQITNTKFVTLDGHNLKAKYFLSHASKEEDSHSHLGVVFTNDTEDIFVRLGSILGTFGGYYKERITKDLLIKSKVHSMVSFAFQNPRYRETLAKMDDIAHTSLEPEYRETYLVKRDDNSICLTKNMITADKFRLVFNKVNLSENGNFSIKNMKVEGISLICDKLQEALRNSDQAKSYSSVFTVGVFNNGKGIANPEGDENSTTPIEMSLQIRDGKLHLGTKAQVKEMLGE